jgi:hypothetical protein
MLRGRSRLRNGQEREAPDSKIKVARAPDDSTGQDRPSGGCENQWARCHKTQSHDRKADRVLGHEKHDPGESVWLAPFEPTGAVLIMALTGKTVKIGH